MYYCGIKPRAMQTQGEVPQKMETIVIHPNKPASPGDSALVAQLKSAATVSLPLSSFLRSLADSPLPASFTSPASSLHQPADANSIANHHNRSATRRNSNHNLVADQEFAG
jgi:hypothetical protein